MAKKIGEEYVKDMLDRGRRELGAAMVTESNIAQPMYPLRGYEPSKEAEPDRGSVFDSRMRDNGPPRDEPERDKGMDRG